MMTMGSFPQVTRIFCLLLTLQQDNSVPANSLSSKIYEERMKVPAQTDALDEWAMKVISQMHTMLLNT
jgi:hypothetical protein